MRHRHRCLPLVAVALALSAALGCQPAGSAPRNNAPPAGAGGGPVASPPTPAGSAAASPAAPAAVSAAPAPLVPAVPVTIADNLTAAGVGLYVAIERGYFAEEGLDVALERMSNPSEIFSQLAAGRFDAAGSSTGPVLFNAVQRGIRLKVVADQSSITPWFTATSGIVVARAAADEGRFPTVASLRGRQVAVASQGSSAEFGMMRVLGHAGLGRDDVQLTVLNFPDVNGALVNGALDAAWQAEPFVTLGVRQGQIHRLIGSEDPSGVVHSASVIVYGEELVARKPEAAERFMVGYLRGVRDSYEAFFGGGQGREAVVAALIKYTPVKDPTLYEDMAVQHQDPNGYVPLEGLRQIAEWSVATGYTQQPVDLAALVDHRYVEKALERLGRYAPPEPASQRPAS